MARTKQTARMSTGGKAPRKSVEARVKAAAQKRREYLNGGVIVRGIPRPDPRAFYAKKIVTSTGIRYYAKPRLGDSRDDPIIIMSEEEIDSSISSDK